MIGDRLAASGWRLPPYIFHAGRAKLLGFDLSESPGNRTRAKVL